VSGKKKPSGGMGGGTIREPERLYLSRVGGWEEKQPKNKGEGLRGPREIEDFVG